MTFSRLKDADIDTYRAIIDGAPSMLWLGDAEGHCIFLNAEQRRFWGADNLATFDWLATLHPEDVPVLAAPYAEAMTSRAEFQVEARYRRADGVWRLLRTTARPRFSPQGDFLGMVGVNTDVTEQREAEKAERRAAELLQRAIEASASIGTWVWDVPQDRIFADRTFAQTFGISAEAAAEGVPLGDFLSAIEPEDRPGVAAAVEAAVAGEEVYRREYRIRDGAGNLRWLLATGRCEHDAAGRPTLFPGVVLDITERKQREEATALLSGELAHRIKNIFTVVQAMIGMAARENPAAAPTLQGLADRLRAMASAYACVTPVGGTGIEGGLRLPALLDTLFSAYRRESGRGIEIETADLPLAPRPATSLALILHEQATNAVKYGALSGDGRVRLRVVEEAGAGDGRSIRFDWEESGGPALGAPPEGEGFGSRLIRASVAALDGEVESRWLASGLHWTLRVPAARLAT